MDLRDYEQTKFAIAEILRAASSLIPDGSIDAQQALRDLFTRLAEDRFNLVVIGRFSRGKTSLMNAILDTDRLPTGIAPLTSVITTITYGSKEQVILRFDNRILDSLIPVDDLPKHITQQGNPGNIEHIKTAEIQLPAEFLRRGFHFVDTPGLGSAIEENTRTTEAFLPEADAFLLVTSYESPLSEEEFQFVRSARQLGHRIFVVVNKHDTVEPQQREDVLAFVRAQLRRLFDHAPPQVFSVSSLDGLKAKRECDPERLTASGIADLERELVRFLLTEKHAQFLLRMCERVREFLSAFAGEQSGSLVHRLDDVARQVEQSAASHAVPPELSTSMPSFRNLHHIRSCEICTRVADEIWRFICRYQYALAMDQDEQRRFAEHGGFCPFHTWEYESIASPYGTCNGYPPLLDRMAEGLRDAARASMPKPAHVLGLLASERDCPLCRVREAAERDAVAATGGRISARGGAALDGLSVICLPHLTMLLDKLEDGALSRRLLERQAAILERLSEDMRRYALKHDAVRRYLASQEETEAAERALLSVAGRRNVNVGTRTR